MAKIEVGAKIITDPLELYADCIKKSSDMALEKAVFTVHGQSGVGKTLLMASASEFFPAELENRKGQPIISLEDILWVGFDRGATASLVDKRLEVPHEIDVLALRAKFAGDMEKTMDAIPDIAARLVDKYKIKYVVGADTGSEMDRMLNTFWAKSVPEEWGKLAGKVTTEHRAYWDALSILPVILMYSFHQRANLDMGLPKADQDRANLKALRETRGVGGELPAVSPEVTNKAASLYVGQCDLEMAMFTRLDAKGKMGRFVKTRPSPEMRAKSRWGDHVPEVCPANMRHIIGLIKSGISEVRNGNSQNPG